MTQFDAYGTLVAASLVLLVGRQLVARVTVLHAHSIPAPVAGGLLAAMLLWALRQTSGAEVRFDMSLSQPLMLAFFASIGLNAAFSSLKKGGRRLLLLIAACVGLLLLQNLLGVLLARFLGLNPLIGLIAGSVSLSGGHGTSAAWGQVFESQHGLPAASAMGLACATFGLVLGGIIGGPVARSLVRRVTLPDPSTRADLLEGMPSFENPAAQRLITAEALVETIALMSVCLLGGRWLAAQLQGTAVSLPVFVCVLFVGVLLRNGLSALGLYEVFERAVSVLGNVGLSLFLAMALMSLRVSELQSLALPLVLVLGAQTLLMVLYARHVTFRAMGSDYDAAVIAAGSCGIGLGATPTAIANMQAVTERFGPAPVAFLVLPLVGAFFIDLANAAVIKLFLALPFVGS